jgi:hypothetical protein
MASLANQTGIFNQAGEKSKTVDQCPLYADCDQERKKSAYCFAEKYAVIAIDSPPVIFGEA